MDVAELGRWIGDHYSRKGDCLFRLEVLPEYTVDDDGPDFRRWLAGAAEPTWSRKEPWLRTLREEHAAGLRASRVRILTHGLTDYERYACEFGYALNAPAGEDIRVLRRGEHAIPQGVREVDFWVATPAGRPDAVAVMRYDELGRFIRAEELTSQRDVAPYVATRDALTAAGEPFLAWWARHPELHRRRAA